MFGDYIKKQIELYNKRLYLISNYKKIIIEKVDILNYHLIELSYNELTINDNSSANIFALYLSLLLAKNNIGINLHNTK